MKRKIRNQALTRLRRNADYVSYCEGPNEWHEGAFGGKYSGRHIRYSVESGRIDIGDGDFDRWANSVACHFKVDLGRPIGPQVERAVIFAKSLKENCTYIDMEDMKPRGGASYQAVMALNAAMQNAAANVTEGAS